MSEIDATNELTLEEIRWLSADSPSTAREDAADAEDESGSGKWMHSQVDPVQLRRQLEVLELFHQDVANRFSDVLSRSLKRAVDVRLTGVRWLTYSQFAYSRPDPTCFFVLKATPLPTSLAIDLTPKMFYPIVDLLLGGGKRPVELPNRPATALELRLARRVIQLLLDELHDAWEPLLAVDLSVDRVESQAQRVRLAAPADSLVSLDFEVFVSDQGGSMALALPYRGIRKMVDKLLVGELYGADGANRSTQK